MTHRTKDAIQNTKSPLKTQQWENSPIKNEPNQNKEDTPMAKEHMRSGSTKVNHGDTTAHLLEHPKSRALTTPTAGEDVEPQERPSLLGGMPNAAATLEDSLGVS